MSTTAINPDSTSPAQGGVAVTPSDVTLLVPAPCRALWVGGAGNLSLLMADGATVTISSVPAGTLLPFAVRRVNATLTTATLIVAVY